jgi:hypothetical protein
MPELPNPGSDEFKEHMKGIPDWVIPYDAFQLNWNREEENEPTYEIDISRDRIDYVVGAEEYYLVHFMEDGVTYRPLLEPSLAEELMLKGVAFCRREAVSPYEYESALDVKASSQVLNDELAELFDELDMEGIEGLAEPSPADANGLVLSKFDHDKPIRDDYPSWVTSDVVVEVSFEGDSELALVIGRDRIDYYPQYGIHFITRVLPGSDEAILLGKSIWF